MTRIRKRLDKGKQPVAPPTLQVGPAPFEHLTEEIMLSQDSLLVFLKSDIQFVVQQARYTHMLILMYSTLYLLCTTYIHRFTIHIVYVILRAVPRRVVLRMYRNGFYSCDAAKQQDTTGGM